MGIFPDWLSPVILDPVEINEVSYDDGPPEIISVEYGEEE